MPSQDETLEFQRALQSARTYASGYERVSPYLDEAERCFDAEGYRATIVMLWCAASARLNEDVERLGATGFLKSDRDSDILVHSKKVGILTRKREEVLRGCLGDRNNCAHPSAEVYGAPEVIGYIRDLNRALFGYPLSIDPSTFKQILLMEDPISPEQADFLVASLRKNKRSRRLPHVLVDEYFRSGPRVREKIRLIWQTGSSTASGEEPEYRLKEHLDLSQQEKAAIMKHLARKLESSGQSHQPTEIAQVIFWEVLADDDIDDRTLQGIYEYFTLQHEYLTVLLLRKLRKYAPNGYREQLEQY